MKRKAKISLFVLTVVVIVACLIAAVVMRRTAIVDGLSINIEYGTCDTLVTVPDLENSLLSAFPGIMSLPVGDIHVKDIANELSKNPYVQSARASVSVGGRIVVNVVQRRPIVRVFYDGVEFYADELGHCFPPSQYGNANVVVANGDFQQRLAGDIRNLDLSKLASDSIRCGYDIVNVWLMAKYLDSHYDDIGILFDQIYVLSNGDIVLQPNMTSHEVIIGSAENLDRKFQNLRLFYAKGLSHAGYASYSRVNLKFEGQVVCTKTNNK